MAKKKVEQEVREEVVNENIQEEQVVEIPELTLEDFKEKVAIRKNIGVLEKQKIVQIIYDNCLEKDVANNVFYRNTVMEKSALNLAVLDSYTDFYKAIDNASYYGYDYLNEIGIFDYILDNVNVTDIQEAIKTFPNRIADLNSVGSCLHRTINQMTKMLSSKEFKTAFQDLPTLIKKMDKNNVANIISSNINNK